MNAVLPYGRALLGAGIVLAVAGALRWATPEYVDAGLAPRLLGVLLGAIVVFYANAVPKSLTKLASLRCAPAREQAARRFAGWALVLGGLGYMLAALFAPLASMHLVGGGLLGLALLAAVLRCVGAASTPA